MKIVVPTEIEDDVDRCVEATLGGVGLEDDPLSLPALTKLTRDLADIGIVALPKDREVPTPRKVEDILYAGVAPPGKQCAVEPVARRKAMVHALAHRAELSGHETTGLGGPERDRMFDLIGIEIEEVGNRCCDSRGSEDLTRVPPSGQHVRPVQCETDTRGDFTTDDRCGQQVESGDGGVGYACGRK